jgi:hypothetical protein
MGLGPIDNFGPVPVPMPAVAPAPVMEPVPDPIPAPVTPIIFPNPNYGIRESKRETEKVEAFADDNNIIAKLDEQAIVTIVKVVRDYGELSGLKCNVDKSQILIIGTDEIPEYIANSGFAVVDELKILGFIITKNHNDLKNNFILVLDKIKKIIRFWDRFKLSLPGRINVAKTLLLSQISFFATILDPDPQILDEIQRSVNNFVTGSFRFEKNMINAGADIGGLGMIDLKNYIHSLHCSLVKRADKATFDNWRVDLKRFAGGNVTNIDPEQIGPAKPILKTLALSFWHFKQAYFSTDKKFFSSSFYGNPVLINNKRDKLSVKDDILHSNERDIDHILLKNIKISDFSVDGVNVIPLAEMQRKTNINISIENYDKIVRCIKDSWTSIKKHNFSEANVDLSRFIHRFRKGSKQFRKVMDNFFLQSKKFKISRSASTFFRLANITIPNEKFLRYFNCLWINNSFPI